MERKNDKKEVVFVGKGVYERDFKDHGKKVTLKPGIVTPVTDEMFLILKDAHDVHPIWGYSDEVQGKPTVAGIVSDAVKKTVNKAKGK
jgi:hypothetical protein